MDSPFKLKKGRALSGQCECGLEDLIKIVIGIPCEGLELEFY